MSEEKRGYMKMEDGDMMEINAVAEAWTRSVQMETVFEVAKRLHFHFTAHIFMSDRPEFEKLKEFYEIDETDINRTPQKINEMTASILDKLDTIVGFESVTEEQMEELVALEDETNPLPDADFFKELGLN